MKSSIRLLALASLPAAVLALGCAGNSKQPQPYTADRAPVASGPAYPTTPQTPSRAPGWSAPIWRGPVPTAGSTTTSRTPVATAPYVPPTMSAPMPPMPPSGGQAFDWAGSLRQAQDSARAQSKLIFIEAGREACGNCQFLKREVIPSSAVNAELGSMSVGFYDDVDKTPYSDAYNLVSANIQSAGTLPLCGWVTPDLRWVHGFWGRRDATKFLAEISTARSNYQRMASAARPATGAALRALPSIGSLPDAELADVSAELSDDKMIDTPLMGEAPALAAATPPAVVDVEPIAPFTPKVDSSNGAPLFASVSPSEMPALTPVAPVAAPVVAEVATPAPSADEVARSWARDELKRAATALAARQYAEARSILSGVREKAKGFPESREADKGEVAIHNLRKIERAGLSAEADRVRAAAHRDLKDTVWMSLFA